ncbi:hypothetical protein GLAREA_09862 [Glarea lozoyensis ATCC 20868]|uniref:Uncharacterized protein n=1 Tax=Glarea lozoyensis (strain ATCC 20868 / MF5171) TaxID=1116229 RepID=S3D9T8_GLAL2|nr:uncharacterized protein GLAREA_09862 [Glarea lozoyensis ATCC 20868]EPE28741.1 hypothetical protein GLAREA_09862 [Glarea lozoyensis ATCC 20868]
MCQEFIEKFPGCPNEEHYKHQGWAPCKDALRKKVETPCLRENEPGKPEKYDKDKVMKKPLITVRLERCEECERDKREAAEEAKKDAEMQEAFEKMRDSGNRVGGDVPAQGMLTTEERRRRETMEQGGGDMSQQGMLTTEQRRQLEAKKKGEASK